jgi:hypothetical protein
VSDRACGKRHHIARPPKCNSRLHWALYFQRNPAIVTIAARVIVEKGEAELERVVGSKYVKFLRRFREESNGRPGND